MNKYDKVILYTEKKNSYKQIMQWEYAINQFLIFNCGEGIENTASLLLNRKVIFLIEKWRHQTAELDIN